MRSALDVRVCHLLRVMRAAAPVEWREGLPFPSCAAMLLRERGIEPSEGLRRLAA
jgi:hypothetical protein